MLRFSFVFITFFLILFVASCSTYQKTEKIHQAELASASFIRANK